VLIQLNVSTGPSLELDNDFAEELSATFIDARELEEATFEFDEVRVPLDGLPVPPWAMSSSYSISASATVFPSHPNKPKLKATATPAINPNFISSSFLTHE
jgi:hypothetical protein